MAVESSVDSRDAPFFGDEQGGWRWDDYGCNSTVWTDTGTIIGMSPGPGTTNDSRYTLAMHTGMISTTIYRNSSHFFYRTACHSFNTVHERLPE
jgi:hypothetical protein